MDVPYKYLQDKKQVPSKFNTICNAKRGVCIFHLILVGHRISHFRISTAIMLS